MIELWYPKAASATKAILYITDRSKTDDVRIVSVGRIDGSSRGVGSEKYMRENSLKVNYEPRQFLSLTEMASKYRLEIDDVRRIYGDLCFRPLQRHGLPDELYEKPTVARPVKWSVPSGSAASQLPTAANDKSIENQILQEQKKTNEWLEKIYTLWADSPNKKQEPEKSFTLNGASHADLLSH